MWTLKTARSTARRSRSGVGETSLLLYMLARGLLQIVNEVLQHDFLVVRLGVHRVCRTVIGGVRIVELKHFVLAQQPIDAEVS